MSPLTGEELAELARLESEAHPGPWRHSHKDCLHFMSSTFIDREGDGNGIGLVASDINQYNATLYASDADMDLIAAARNALPRLLSDLAAARAEADRLREALKKIEQHEEGTAQWGTICFQCQEKQEIAIDALAPSVAPAAPSDADLMAVLPPATLPDVPAPSPDSANRLRDRLVAAAAQEKGEEAYCPCRRCVESAWGKKKQEAEAKGETLPRFPLDNPTSRMILCPICGNKRCPHATFHENACTGSNLPGQPGSDYPDVWGKPS